MVQAWLRHRATVLASVAAALVLPTQILPLQHIWGWLSWGSGCFGAGFWPGGQFIVGGCVSRYVPWWEAGSLLGLIRPAAALLAVVGIVLLAVRRGAIGGDGWRAGLACWIGAWSLASVFALVAIAEGPWPGPGLVAGWISVVALRAQTAGADEMASTSPPASRDQPS